MLSFHSTINATHLMAHLQFTQANATTKNCKRAIKPTHQN